MPDWAAIIIIFTVIIVVSFGLGWLLAWTESDHAPRRRGSFWHAWSRR